MQSILALDPGNRVGLAVLDGAGTLIACETLDWYEQHAELTDRLRRLCLDLAPIVIIERPRKGSMRRRSRAIGRCEEKALTLGELCRHYGGAVKMVKPVYALTKNRAAFESAFPYWKKRTSNHARDAACLAWVYRAGL